MTDFHCQISDPNLISDLSTGFSKQENAHVDLSNHTRCGNQFSSALEPWNVAVQFIPIMEWSFPANQPRFLTPSFFSCSIIKVLCHDGSLYFVYERGPAGVLFDQQECLR